MGYPGGVRVVTGGPQKRRRHEHRRREGEPCALKWARGHNTRNVDTCGSWKRPGNRSATGASRKGTALPIP